MSLRPTVRRAADPSYAHVGLSSPQQLVASARNRFARESFYLKIFLWYCAIFYFVPFALFIFLGNPLEASFAPAPNYAIALAYIVFSLYWFAFVVKITPVKFRAVPYYISSMVFGPYSALVLALSFLSISLWSYVALGFQFRQTGDALSEVGLLGFLLVFGKVLMGTSIIVNYRLVKEGKSPSIRSAALLLIAIGFMVNAQSAVDILFSFTAYVAASHIIRRKINLTGKLIQSASLIVLPFLVVAIFFVGKSNKVGVEEALYIVSDAKLFFAAFLHRYSYALYSTAANIEENFFNFGLALSALKEVASIFQFRLYSAIGLAAERPELGSIARMNFFVLSHFYQDRIGVSPSMLGSVFYFPGAGFAILYYVFFIRFIYDLFWRIMGTKMNNWLFTILAVLLSATAVDAFLDSINPLSNGFARIVTLYLGASFIGHALSFGVDHAKGGSGRSKFSNSIVRS
ncbi:hypothetical protein GRI55_14170 [Erythrobacter citreus]|uniref:Oligosaccharide repeat unit polymerase n=1 Tax=Qipengyuania citrea TaxID=225971 RepID=A0A6I4UHX6_9SPHN|nr:hypothetical protein [Qipengyuania citrea]MDQ0567349.1 hypothetical protein [Qipengyuania citrea]MXP36893.1 hypothetical protein [Qipengyuania citrea]